MTALTRIEYMPLGDLLTRFHEQNPKDHDVGYLASLMKQFGYTSPGAIDEHTGKFIEGHGRTETLAWLKAQGAPAPKRIDVRADDWYVPVVRGIAFDTPDEVRAYLIASNRATERGGWNEPALASLLQDIQNADAELFDATGFDADDLDALLYNLQLDSTLTTTTDGVQGSDGSGEWFDRVYAPDAIYASDNDYDIPLLRLDLQATRMELPFAVWGSRARSSTLAGGTYAFYVDDARFQPLWQKPEPIIYSRCAQIVEPNFSCYESMPLAVGAYQIYRKRWIARWAQDYGVRVFVDLNVAEKFRDLNLMGVPRGWRAYCTRGSVDYIHQLDEEFDAAAERAETRDLLFVVYGGGKASKALAKTRGWLWINDQQTAKVRENYEVQDGE